MLLTIVIVFIASLSLSIFLTWIAEAIPQRNIIENLYQFRQPLTFNFKGIDFTVSKRELYSDFNVCITEVLINDEVVLQAYKLETLWLKHRYIRYSTNRSTSEIQEILKQASKVYSENLSKEFEAKWQSQSYFKEGK